MTPQSADLGTGANPDDGLVPGDARVPGVSAVYAYRSTEQLPADERSPHRGMPSPTLTLIVTAGERLLCSPTYDDWSTRTGPTYEVCLGQLHTGPVFLQRPDRQEGVQVEIHPLAARRLLGLPAAELTGLTQEGGDVVGPALRRLRARVHSTDVAGERTRLVSEALAGLAAQGERRAAPRSEVVGAWRLLELSRGRMTVGEVADRVALTPRHLQHLVRAELGVSPKQLADLFRFHTASQRVVNQLHRGRTPHLPDIAARSGYSDHSHLVRSFHAHLGTSPSAWIAEEFRNVQAPGRLTARDFEA